MKIKQKIEQHPVASILLSALVGAGIGIGTASLLGIPFWAELLIMSVAEVLGAVLGVLVVRKCQDEE